MGFKEDPIKTFCTIVATIVRAGRATEVSKGVQSGNVHVRIGQLYITFTTLQVSQKDFVHIYLGGWSTQDGGKLLHSLPKTKQVDMLLADIEGGRFHLPYYPNVAQATEKRLLNLFEL